MSRSLKIKHAENTCPEMDDLNKIGDGTNYLLLNEFLS